MPCVCVRTVVCFICVWEENARLFPARLRGAKFNLCEINKWVAGQICVWSRDSFWGMGATGSQAVALNHLGPDYSCFKCLRWFLTQTRESFNVLNVFRKLCATLSYVDLKMFIGWEITLRDKTRGREMGEGIWGQRVHEDLLLVSICSYWYLDLSLFTFSFYICWFDIYLAVRSCISCIILFLIIIIKL